MFNRDYICVHAIQISNPDETDLIRIKCALLLDKTLIRYKLLTRKIISVIGYMDAYFAMIIATKALLTSFVPRKI